MKKITIITFLTVLFSVTSCEKYLDVNKNIDAPDRIDSYLYLSGILQSYQDIYNDLHAIAPMIEMWGTTNANYTPFANHFYYKSSDVGGVVWRTVYWGQGMNLENLINQSIAAEEWTLVGIGYAIKSFSWDMLTKLYADVPLKQAFSTGRTIYDYDYQNEIYTQVRAWAREAIKYLEMDDKTSYGSKLTDHDWIYKGDKAKWIKFAYAVIVRNLASLSNKTGFVTQYADELIECAGKSFQSADDDARVGVSGGSQSVPYSGFNNFWGTARNNLGQTSFQHDYAVQVMTGTVPVYEADGNRKKVVIPPTHEDTLYYAYYPYELVPQQIICDTSKATGHFDPRVIAKLSTTTNQYMYIDNADSVKAYKYYGARRSTERINPIDAGGVPTFFGRDAAVKNGSTAPPNDGKGRWIYHDEAPYILTTCAEIKFCLAEAYWKKGQKGLAYEAFKEGVKADIAFTAGQLRPGAKGQEVGGDKVTAAVFNTLANEYTAGPYVDGLGEANLTLSHIMMQKWVALYPWGAMEAWVDMRKYHYDIAYTGNYPTLGNGWDATRRIQHKADDAQDRLYKGFYLGAAERLEFRDAPYNIENEGSPCYRLRPRYNSEYIWNIPSLEKLKPIAGTAPNYQCSIPWFAYPGDYPAN
ncbi:MAG: SusD/RagB family nutrient-binding outer membrane lipoprotein [Prevotellaceae bacterium]|jgi:hypothetical protein|nr:SusD/RagB family nutrient-binding outer membrane lipoprotein [Prevotellaceae bacterium]